MTKGIYRLPQPKKPRVRAIQTSLFQGENNDCAALEMEEITDQSPIQTSFGVDNARLSLTRSFGSQISRSRKSGCVPSSDPAMWTMFMLCFLTVLGLMLYTIILGSAK